VARGTRAHRTSRASSGAVDGDAAAAAAAAAGGGGDDEDPLLPLLSMMAVCVCVCVCVCETLRPPRAPPAPPRHGTEVPVDLLLHLVVCGLWSVVCGDTRGTLDPAGGREKRREGEREGGR